MGNLLGPIALGKVGPLTALLALAHPALVAATKAKTQGGSSLFLVFLIVIAIAGYFFFLRPQQQKARKQRQMQSDVAEGDEVVTVGGIVGRVLKMDGDRVHLLTGYHSTPDLPEHLPHRMTFVRNAISRKVEPPAEEEPTDELEDESDDDELSAGAYATNGHGSLTAADDEVEPDVAEDFTTNGHTTNGHAEGGLVERGLVEPDAVAGADPAAGPEATAEEAPGAERRKGRGRRPQGGTREGTTS